ncbi:adhesion G protein-coupled receptor E5-like [Heterodontus francisci]|uniref:adhesion G protein-coupled receptor E5-like n=1 Tax=Heterodontus francisci TaxID=7792 RepID=UPI00355AF5C5
MKSRYSFLILVFHGSTIFTVVENTCTWLNFSSDTQGKYEIPSNLKQVDSLRIVTLWNHTGTVVYIITNSTNSSEAETKKFSVGNNSLEIHSSTIKDAAESGNASFAFIAINGLSTAKQYKDIKYVSAGAKFYLSSVTNAATVITNNVSACDVSPPIKLNFPNDQNLRAEEIACAHLRVEDCLQVWTSDGCDVVSTNNTSIGCNCTGLSTVTVLKRIKSIESAINAMKSFQPITSTPSNVNKTERFKTITANLKRMEDVTQMLAADAVTQGEVKISTDILEVTVQALQINSSLTGRASLFTTTTRAWMPWDTIRGNKMSGVVYMATIVLKGSESGMDADFLTKKYETKPKLVSDVLTVSISSQETEKLSSPLIMSFTLSENKHPNQSALCVYWKSTDNETGWVSDGCTMERSEGTEIICSCTHLTSFAVLLSLNPIPAADEKILQLITYIGLGVSLFCLLLSLIVFVICRSIKNIRLTIHKHLCLSLFLAELLFILDFAKTNNEIACKVAAIFLHYLFLACFVWMLLEGIQLYLMVVKVFHSRSLRRAYLYLVGYGGPLVIVIITIANNFQAYGTETYCWLTLKSGYIWAFLGPVCVIIGFNTIFFIITVWKLIDKFSILSSDIPHFKKVRSFTCSAIAQLVLLGGTWIFGMFHFNNQSIVMSYIFTALNSFQGLFIFILHCLLNKQVRNEFLDVIMRISRGTSKNSSQETSWKGLQRLQEIHRSEEMSNIYLKD